MDIGHVTFHHQGRPVVATLSDEFVWRVEGLGEQDAEVYEDLLSSQCHARDYSPAHGVAGNLLIKKAARLLQGVGIITRTCPALPAEAKA